MTNNYLDSLLVKDEEVIFTTHVHWLVLAGRLFTDILAVILLIYALTAAWLPDWLDLLVYIVLVVFLGVILYKIVAWRSHQYVVTTRRVLQVKGILSKSTTDTSLEKVSDMNLQQSFWGRILDYGTIKLLTAAEDGSDQFENISRPIDFQTIVRETKEKIVNQSSNDGGDSPSDLSALMEQLNTLHENGLLTKEEYEAKRIQVLDRL